MTRTVRFTFITLALLIFGSLLAGTAAAHATAYSPDGKIRFVYGHTDEPTYTFMKTGLDLAIRDNATGAGIGGLDTDARHGEETGAHSTPKLWVNIRYGGEGGPMKNISEDFRAQHGQVGRYTHPITYTRPGLYYLVITGTINGTQLNNFVIAPAHAIESQEEIMWPEKYDDGAAQSARIKQLEQKVAQLEGSPARGAAAGIEVVPLLAAIAIIALMVRRR